MSEKPTRILLIRHGQNDYVKTKQLAGWTPGVHLNEHGQAQARATAERLASETLAAIYSSPLERTRETAQCIAEPHALPVIIRRELGEADCGEWTGQVIDDLTKTELWQQVQRYPSGARFPGGESFPEIQARLVAVLDALCADHHGQTIAVVSHSDPLKTAIAHYIGLHLDLFQRLMIDPASVTELLFTPTGPRLVYCNDSSHLPKSEDEHK